MEKEFNKPILYQYKKYLDNEQFKVIVLEDEEYYNIHILSEKYKSDELNTLQLQEPKESIKEPNKYFNNARLISYLMDFFIWDRFYNEGIFNGYCVIGFDKH